MPLLCRVALGKVPFVNVFGSDYPTRDGSGCRDFIHVMDVASAHVLALSKLYASGVESSPFSVFNLGSETGYTVLEMIDTLQKVSGAEVPYKVKSLNKTLSSVQLILNNRWPPDAMEILQQSSRCVF